MRGGLAQRVQATGDQKARLPGNASHGTNGALLCLPTPGVTVASSELKQTWRSAGVPSLVAQTGTKPPLARPTDPSDESGRDTTNYPPSHTRGVSLSWTYDQGPRRLIPRLPEDPTKPLNRSPGARQRLGLKLSKGRRSTPRLPEDPTPPLVHVPSTSPWAEPAETPAPGPGGDKCSNSPPGIWAPS